MSLDFKLGKSEGEAEGLRGEWDKIKCQNSQHREKLLCQSQVRFKMYTSISSGAVFYFLSEFIPVHH